MWRRDGLWQLVGIEYPILLAPMAGAANRTPFAEIHCELIEELRPAVASFHFGLPEERLLARVKTTGCKILSSATTVAQAR